MRIDYQKTLMLYVNSVINEFQNSLEVRKHCYFCDYTFLFGKMFNPSSAKP